ncbi:MAG: cyclic nucleotide-binding domain-containing protein [Verrucomicrobia bacterium]|nr:cyclic nucleotide-binding domain-containing protein [Verrucomicrobiota bacterium]MBT6658784.1 cyclic nucleotide-binding domain-containing protein [Verrucomicrobiota bacterium]
MTLDSEEIHYKVWASDNVVYGPVLLVTLLEWVADGRVTPGTWVFSEEVNSWKPAKTLPALGDALANYHASQAPLPKPTKLGQASDSITVEQLRQFDQLAGLGQAELKQFISHCTVMEIEEGGIIMKKGSPGNGLYMILSGDTRVRIIAAGQDTTLATIKAGNFIGEVAMFSQTQRSADVLALTRCQLLFMSAEAFRGMMETEPKLASAVLFALGHMMAERMVAGNDRLQIKASSDFLWL